MAMQRQQPAVVGDSQGHRQVHLQEGDSSPVSKRLYAAKPVSWRGKGDLLQCPWVIVPKGPFLVIVIDLWSGMWGLPIALSCMATTFYTLAAECDADARQACASSMPNIVHVEDVAKVRASDFVEFLERRKPRAIIIGGGSPCQRNSNLNTRRKGLGDPHSHQPLELCRIQDEFQSLPCAQDIPIITFLENVGSMPREVQERYTHWLGPPPVRIEAISCGWVHRNRCFWLGCGDVGVSPSHTPPADWAWAPSTAQEAPVLKFNGKKPIPPRVSWEAGYAPLFNPLEVLQGESSLGFHPFTREFFHPPDRVNQASPEAAARFFEDSCRFNQWRTPTPGERCQLMGLPPAAVSAVGGPSARRRQTQNSLIGNGFHIPSVLAMLCFLPYLLPAKIAPPILDYQEEALKQRLEGTIWEPGRIDVFPNLMDSRTVVSELQNLFAWVQLDPCLWTSLEHRLSHCRLYKLQFFPAWCRMRGWDWDVLGPTPLTSKDRAAIFAGLSGQRYPSASSRGLDHLLPPGLGPEVHMAASDKLPSPFLPRPWPEPDVTFLVQALITWRQFRIPFAADFGVFSSPLRRQ